MTDNRIYNIDCRTGVKQHIRDNSVDIILTDPPFGVAFHSNSSVTPEGKAWAKPIENDGDVDVALSVFEEAMVPLVRDKGKDELEVYIFTSWKVLPPWMLHMERYEEFDLHLKMMLVWDKMEPGMGDLDGNWGCGHEIILYLKRGRKPMPRRRGAVLGFHKTPPAHAIHPTEKPVGLLSELLSMSGKAGDMVVDLFSGSGSTAVAAKSLGMNSIGFETDANHHERSLERLTQDTLF